MARAVIDLGEGAKLLYNLHGLDTMLDLPSWVPDWSNQHFPHFSVSPIPGSASKTIDIPYVRAGGLHSEMQVSEDGNSLQCTGYIVDTIDRLTDSNINDDDDDNDPKEETSKTDKRKPSHSYRYLCRCLQS